MMKTRRVGVGLQNGAQNRRKRLKVWLIPLCVVSLMTVFTVGALAAGEVGILDDIFKENADTVEIVLMLTLLALLPTLLVMLTGFVRIVIVLSFVRNAMGVQNIPPNQVIIGLALFITYFVMSPVLAEINETAYMPYTEGQIEIEEFADKAMVPIRDFMYRQTYRDDMDFFIKAADLDAGAKLEEIPNSVVIPAFLTSELKRAFQIGFLIYIPFIVIDMVVASTLMAMGMMMLPPAMISLPFKVLLFVMVDGWTLTIGSLISSFG